MGNQKYSKQAFSIDQQIKFLLHQGLIIDDNEHAKIVLLNKIATQIVSKIEYGRII